MEEPGETAPAIIVPAVTLRPNPPSSKASPKKLVVRNLSSRLKNRKNPTPYPLKSKGSQKRSSLASVPKNKPVRKKISFEDLASSPAGINGNMAQERAGNEQDVVTDPLLHDDTVMELAMEVSPRSNLVGEDDARTSSSSKMAVENNVGPTGPKESHPTHLLPAGASAHASPKGNASKVLLENQPCDTSFPEKCSTFSNLEAGPLTDAAKESNNSFPPLTKGWARKNGERLKEKEEEHHGEPLEGQGALQGQQTDVSPKLAGISTPINQSEMIVDGKKRLEDLDATHNSPQLQHELNGSIEIEKSIPTQGPKNVQNGLLKTGGPQHPLTGEGSVTAGAEPTNPTAAPNTTENVWVKADHLRHPLVRSVAAT